MFNGLTAIILLRFSLRENRLPSSLNGRKERNHKYNKPIIKINII